MTSLAGRAPTRGTEARDPIPRNVTTASAGDASVAAVAAVTLERARDHLLSLQDPSGYWIGELETNVTMDAEDVLLRHFLGILT